MLRFIYAALAALSLCSCSLGNNNDHICSTPEPIDISGTSDQAQKTDSCLHRWGYRLAKAPDEANTIAQAVIGACHDAVATSIIADRIAKIQQNSQSADDKIFEGQKAVKEDGTAVFEYEGASRGWVKATEKDDDYRRAQYQRLALFYVVQARAGKCSAP